VRGFPPPPPVGLTFLESVQSGFEAHPASCTIQNGRQVTVHHIRTHNQFNVTQHSSCCFQSAFPTEFDEETITGLGVPWPTVRDHMKKDLKMRPYRPTFMIELSDADVDWRCVSPYAAPRFFAVGNVPPVAVRATEIWCSGQMRIPISRRSCNIVHYMLRYGRV